MPRVEGKPPGECARELAVDFRVGARTLDTAATQALRQRLEAIAVPNVRRNPEDAAPVPTVDDADMLDPNAAKTDACHVS